MTTFVSQISRDLAQRYGEQAVQIIQDGGYNTPSGRRVNLAEAIGHAVQATIAYPPETKFTSHQIGSAETQFEVENETTLSAVQHLLAGGYNPVVLNFASATHPGGGFLNGARAQEEYLARSSAIW